MGNGQRSHFSLAPLAAQKAVDALNGRFFAKRAISADLYDQDKFQRGDYSG